MKVEHAIATTVTGTLDEVLNAKVTDVPALEQVLAVLERVTFIAETVAHLQGKEREILPTTDAAREILNAFK